MLLNVSGESGEAQGFIKILGKSSDNALESITQAAFVDRLLKMISRDPDGDKDLLKRGKSPAKATGGDRKKLLFRNLFLKNEDPRIAYILWEYFKAVHLRWPGALTNRDRGMILGRTTGFAALMRLLPEILVRLTARPLDEDTSNLHHEEIYELLRLIDIEADDFNSAIYLPGSTGEAKLFSDLVGFLQEKPERWFNQSLI